MENRITIRMDGKLYAKLVKQSKKEKNTIAVIARAAIESHLK